MAPLRQGTRAHFLWRTVRDRMNSKEYYWEYPLYKCALSTTACLSRAKTIKSLCNISITLVGTSPRLFWCFLQEWRSISSKAAGMWQAHEIQKLAMWMNYRERSRKQEVYQGQRSSKSAPTSNMKIIKHFQLRPRRRVSSPDLGASTLMTSAPMSAISIVAEGPGSILSTLRSPKLQTEPGKCRTLGTQIQR